MAVASDYANLWCWLKGDTGFTDQSGTSHSPTLPGGTNNPTTTSAVANGHDVLEFAAASSQYFTLPSMASFTKGEVFVVVKLNSAAPASPKYGLWDMGFGSSSSWVSFPYTTAHIWDSWGSTVSRDLGIPSTALNSKYVVYNVRSTNNLWAATLQGATLSTTATNTIQFLATPEFGRSTHLASTVQYLDGRVAELAIYNDILDADERAALINSLMATYNGTSIASDYTGLWTWYKGSTGGWTDQSGNGRNATLPGGTQNPTILTAAANGHDVFKFVGTSNQYVTLPSMAALTKGEIFAVYMLPKVPPTAATEYCSWSMGTSESAHSSYAMFSDSKIYEGFGTNTRKDNMITPFDLSADFRVINCWSDTNNWGYSVDDVPLFTTTSNTVGFPSTVYIGRGPHDSIWSHYWLAELFIYSELRTTAERSKLINQLKNTYQLAPDIGAEARVNGLTSSVIAVDQPVPVPQLIFNGLTVSIITMDSITAGTKIPSRGRILG
jgi:hypothetical protein